MRKDPDLKSSYERCIQIIFSWILRDFRWTIILIMCQMLVTKAAATPSLFQDAYVKMLQWGWDYEVVQPVLPFCQVCEWLYDGRRARKPYWDAVKWWHEGACHRPQDL